MSYFSFDSRDKGKKCAVIGCHGIGGTIAHALAASGLPDALVLIDRDKRLADGQAADLCSALPLRSDMDIWAGESSDLADCALIVLAVGASPVHETAQTDLIEINAPLVRHVASEITAYNKDAVIVVVSQPMDTMTYTALRYAGLPSEQIIGPGTLIYSQRLRYLIGKYLGVDWHQVDIMILGEQGARATVCWSLARVCGMPLDAYLNAMGRGGDLPVLKSLFDDILQEHERAVDAKGHADHTIAQAVISLADIILHDRHTVLPLCTFTNGYAELSHVCMSLPCMLGKRGATIVPQLLPAPAELEQLQRSATRLRARIPEVEKSFSAK